MSESIDLSEVTSLLKELHSGTYREIPVDDSPSEERRQFVSALNALAAQKSDLIQNYNEDLKQSETRLRNIIESTPVGICITDEQGYFEYMNPTYCKLYGYEPSDLIGNHFTMMVPEKNRETLIHLHSEFMGRRYELRGEWEVVRADGSPMAIIADAAYIIDVDGLPKKVTFVLDISERKKAEELLEQTVNQLNEEIRQREELERVKTEVERMIRHDLRNPLNGVIAAAEIMMADDLTAEHRELCVIIRESGRKLDSMLSSSMDLVKMEEGTYELRARPMNLVEVLKEVRRETEPLAANSNIEVRYKIDGEPMRGSELLQMEGERLYLADALANLVRNAIEASGSGNEVQVDVTSGDDFQIAIHNTGVVPEEIRTVFFDRYATSGKKGGTGLGTYVAALITRMHSGSIDYTTSEQDGTTVSLILPKTQPRATKE
jgi:PAS domain S-box-containing protein